MSFPLDSPPLELESLNVLIGPNGAGKSNLIESIRFLKASTLQAALGPNFLARDGAGISDWIWKGARNATASVEILLAESSKKKGLRYRLAFREQRSRLDIFEERLEEEKASQAGRKPFFYIGHERLGVYVNKKGSRGRTLTREQMGPEASVLSVYNAPADYPESAWMCEALRGIQLFTDPWFIERRVWQGPAQLLGVGADGPGESLGVI